MPSPNTDPSPFRGLFLRLLARPVARFLTGADVVGREKLPLTGPAIVAANHNSHMDTFLLLSVFPAEVLAKVRPVAAADYFLAGPALSWFARRLIGITPISRTVARGEDVLAPAKAALARGEIVLVFPEGTRGAPDELAPLKSGVARLAEAFPEAPVVPVWIQGAGRVLPKGAIVPVPMNCSVQVGEALRWSGDKPGFMSALRDRLAELQASAPPLRWR
ncbi:lysophospholipid acyltransferase family protein [Caulobacter sp. 17J65-9]|uniref:lysophospholipid acyltransferase family protein n=1 Tax=Caulobacter sp. 17J65-9 TaxID=2709382 RepID=UPI0013C75C28|nr:lysophospholipid acyltransferase family protein [Caulobacter sp. 17J65-9]NEX93599.1 1-acyl-sn-glycerol-3-phosphate acyltransferase [Caulobacter sp. 17J65-9]